MNINLIKTVIEVANTGSFVAARDRLFMTQLAISLRIQRFEDSLGHQLFTGSKAGVVLTAEGKLFDAERKFKLVYFAFWAYAFRHVPGFPLWRRKRFLSLMTTLKLVPSFGDALREMVFL